MAAITYADEARLCREGEARQHRFYHYGVEYIDAGTVDRRVRDAVEKTRRKKPMPNDDLLTGVIAYPTFFIHIRVGGQEFVECREPIERKRIIAEPELADLKVLVGSGAREATLCPNCLGVYLVKLARAETKRQHGFCACELCKGGA